MITARIFALLALGLAPFLSSGSAHPGEVLSGLSLKRQAALTQSIAAHGAERLARCAASINARALRKRAIARRTVKVNALRKRASKRDAANIETYDVSHNYTGAVTSDDAFNGNTSCILEPQLTIGPYWVEGELIRSDPTEDQEGVDMQLELQFIDVNTCEPVSNLYIDLWNANSTGVYSGVVESSLDSTYLRAIQITDGDGVVTFDTLVPGHYQGRAVHSHIMVHQNVTRYSNNTYAGGTVRSISQLFYDTELRAAVESVEPYSSNTNEITTNEDDSLLSSITLGDYDPFIKYIYLGEGITDGIFAWHSIGIDITANYTSNEAAASHYYETGGIDESGSNTIGGGRPAGSFDGTGAPSNGSAVFQTMRGTAQASGAPVGTGTSYVLVEAAPTTSSSCAGTVHTSGSLSDKTKPCHSVEHSSKEPSLSTEHSSQDSHLSTEHPSKPTSLNAEHSSKETSLTTEHLSKRPSRSKEYPSLKSSHGIEHPSQKPSLDARHPFKEPSLRVEHQPQKTAGSVGHPSQEPSHGTEHPHNQLSRSAEHLFPGATRGAEYAPKKATHNAEQEAMPSWSMSSRPEAQGVKAL